MSDVTEALKPEDEVERRELEAAFRALLQSNAGRRVIYWMLSECGLYKDPYTGDNNATNYRLGTQLPGRNLIARLDNIDPRFYPQLLLDIGEIRAMDRAAAVVADNNEDDDDAP